MADPPVAALKDDQSPGETLEEAKADEENEEKEEDKTEAKATAGASDSDEEKEDNRKCNYRDYSHVQPPDPSSNAAPAIPRRNPPNKEATFPMKLHVIISSPEFWEISWLPHGRSWRINNPKSFEERVIPIFFRHGRYTSFARQVNGWGFRRITHGSDFNSYYHELFLRGMPHLCERMRRLTSKDAGARKKAEDEKTPDLAAISKENPLPDDIPMLPAAAVAATSVTAVPPGAGGMDNYLARLSENGGVDAYLSSLSDAEIAFLARRQMFRQPEMMGSQSPFLGGDPNRMGAMNQAMLGPSGMGGLPSGPNPGMTASLSNPSGRQAGMGGQNSNGASMPSPSGRLSTGMDALAAPSRNNLSTGGSSNAGQANPTQQGNPSVDQFVNRASSNELAQLIAMHDAATARRLQQFGGGGFDSQG